MRLEVCELEERRELAVDAVQTFQKNSVRRDRQRQVAWRWRVDRKRAQLKQMSKQPCADGRGSLAVSVIRCCWRATFVVGCSRSTGSNAYRLGLPALTIWNIQYTNIRTTRVCSINVGDTMPGRTLLYQIKNAVETKLRIVSTTRGNSKESYFGLIKSRKREI